MKKSIILVALAISPLLMLTELADAKPNKDNTPIISDTKKKKVNKTKAVKVAPEHNAFVKSCGFLEFSCNSSVVTNSSDEETVAQYWQKEWARKNPTVVTQPVKAPAEKPRENKVASRRDCMFCEDKSPTYVEAKKWEGKNSRDKNDRKELTMLFNESTIPPIDPGKLPWCAAFANAILNKLGYEGTNSLMARSFLRYGAPTKQPVVGDIVVTKRGNGAIAGHVGFFEGFEEVDGVKYVKVFGGNTDKMVSTGWFPVTAVLGFRKIG